MKKVLTLSVLALAVISTTASAMSINLRHEYMDSDGDQGSRNRDRMTLAHTFANGIGISGEIKWQQEPNSDGDEDFGFGHLKSAGHETVVSYNYKVTDKFTLQPAYGLDDNDSATTHKLNLKGTYKFTDKWNVALRYRYGYKNNADYGAANSHYHQINLTSGYVVGQFGLGIDFEWKIDQEASSGYKGDESYLNLVNFTADYRGFESGWIPFIELGYVSQNTEKYLDAAGKSHEDGRTKEGLDTYNMRYRFGVKYNF
ncbi:MAG: oligogalacturonate-specific porin KdgM family protein [Vibrio sp.]